MKAKIAIVILSLSSIMSGPVFGDTDTNQLAKDLAEATEINIELRLPNTYGDTLMYHITDKVLLKKLAEAVRASN